MKFNINGRKKTLKMLNLGMLADNQESHALVFSLNVTTNFGIRVTSS